MFLDIRPLTAVVAALVALGGGSAAACSCLLGRTAEDHLASSQADLVFKGRALRTRTFSDGTAATTFRPTEVLRGRAGPTVVVRHMVDSAACGVTYRPGRSTLVIAERGGPADYGGGRKPRAGAARPLRTGLCSLPRFPEAEYRRALRSGAGSGGSVR